MPRASPTIGQPRLADDVEESQRPLTPIHLVLLWLDWLHEHTHVLSVHDFQVSMSSIHLFYVDSSRHGWLDARYEKYCVSK